MTHHVCMNHPLQKRPDSMRVRKKRLKCISAQIQLQALVLTIDIASNFTASA